MKNKILLVDAERRSVRVLTVALRSAGYSVKVAGNGIEAIDKVEASMPDVVVSDCQLPKLNGYGLVEKLKSREETAHIPVVLLTTKGAAEDRERGRRLGVAEYLTKPVFVRELVACVSLLVARSARTRLSAGSPTSRAGRFTGSTRDISVVDLLQTFEMLKESGVARLVRGGQDAEIYFRSGRAIEARLGRLRGEQAIYATLLWNEAAFDVEFKPITKEDVIDRSMGTLLVEGMRRVDEWSRVYDQLRPLTALVEVDHSRLLEQVVARLSDGKALASDSDDGPFHDRSLPSVLSGRSPDALAPAPEDDDVDEDQDDGEVDDSVDDTAPPASHRVVAETAPRELRFHAVEAPSPMLAARDAGSQTMASQPIPRPAPARSSDEPLNGTSVHEVRVVDRTVKLEPARKEEAPRATVSIPRGDDATLASAGERRPELGATLPTALESLPPSAATSSPPHEVRAPAPTQREAAERATRGRQATDSPNLGPMARESLASIADSHEVNGSTAGAHAAFSPEPVGQKSLDTNAVHAAAEDGGLAAALEDALLGGDGLTTSPSAPPWSREVDWSADHAPEEEAPVRRPARVITRTGKIVVAASVALATLICILGGLRALNVRQEDRAEDARRLETRTAAAAAMARAHVDTAPPAPPPPPAAEVAAAASTDVPVEGVEATKDTTASNASTNPTGISEPIAADMSPAHPRGRSALVQAAEQSLLQGATDRALVLAGQAVSAEPANADAWLTLAAAHRAAGDDNAAHVDYRKCVAQAHTEGLNHCRVLAGH